MHTGHSLTVVLVMGMFGDRPESTARHPCPPPPRTLGPVLRGKARLWWRQSGCRPGEAQPTCRPQAPLPTEKCAGIAGTWGQDGPQQWVIYVCLLASTVPRLLPALREHGAWHLPAPLSPSPFVLVSHRCRVTSESPGGLSLLPWVGDAPAPGTLMAQAGPEPPVPKCWGPGSSQGRGEWAWPGPLPRCPAQSPAGARQDE